MYRFLWKPSWLVSHLFVFALVLLMLSLGFWQLRRMDEKQALNATIESRSQIPVEDLDAVVEVSAATASGEEVAFRRATATGTYGADRTVAVRNRTLDSAPGFWILTPLVLDDGFELIVNRGWTPFATETDGTDVDFDTPTGEVTVEGLLFESVPPAKDKTGESGRPTISHVDVDWFRDRSDASVYPVFLQMAEQSPPQTSTFPEMLPVPELDDGPHLGYAVQWFIFTTIAVVGYPIILRKVAHQKAGEAEAEAATINLRDDDAVAV